MKILRLTPHYYYSPDVVKRWIVRMDQMGGMQMQIYRQSLALAKKGIQQDIFPITMSDAPKEWSPIEKVKVIRGNIPMIPIKSRIRGTVGLNFYWGVGVFFRIIKCKIVKRKYDIIHTHCSGVSTPLIIGVIAKKILKIPLIYTVHCCRVSTYHPMSKFDALFNNLAIKIERVCLRKADKVIALTDRTKAVIHKEYLLDDNKITVIPDILDYEEFVKDVNEENIEQFKKNFDISKDDIIISFVGRIAYEKGCFVLLDAFEKLQQENCKLFFFGDGNERSILEKQIRERGLENKVKVSGYLPNTEIPLAIASAAFMVMPSLHEEFGGLLLEIAAVGKTVIASDAGGIPTIVKDGKTGLLFHVGDSDMLLEKIKEAIENREVVSEYGKKLHDEVCSKYVYDDKIDSVIDIYNN